MFKIDSLVDREFLGKVLPDLDEKLKGRYKVHLPELMSHLPNDQGLFFKNHVHKWRITNSDRGEYGQYFPIQPGTFVVVKFFENDPNTGYIDRIISDYVDGSNVEAQDCTTPIPRPSDRDEQYIIFKTPKKWNALYINEDTAYEPNTICLVYNRDGQFRRRSVLRIDESGIHTWTRDNMRTRILKDDNKQVDGNQTENIKGYRTKHIVEDDDLAVYANRRKTIDQNEDNWIKWDRSTIIGEPYDPTKHETEPGNDYLKVGKDQQTHIIGNRSSLVEGDTDHITEGSTSEKLVGPRNTEMDDNWDMIVKGDFFFTIDKNHNLLIKKSSFTLAEVDVNITGNVNVNIASGAHTNILAGENINITAGSGLNLTTGSNCSIESTGNANITTDGNCNIQSSGDTNIDVGANANVKTGTDANILTGTNANIQSGTDTNILAGANCNIQSTSGTSLSSDAQVMIDAPAVSINADTSCMVKSAMLNLEGDMVNIKSSSVVAIQGSAGVTIDGAAVAINGGGSAAPAVTIPSVPAISATSAESPDPITEETEEAAEPEEAQPPIILPFEIGVEPAKPTTFVRDLEPVSRGTFEYLFEPRDVDGRPFIVGNPCDGITEAYNAGPRQTINKDKSFPVAEDPEATTEV